MSMMDYNTARRYSPHSLPFSNYYSQDRTSPLAHAHATRIDPRNYQLRSPHDGNGMRPRSGFGQEEHPVENVQSRRRIAVACARCRKRKIRCSGDPGTGTGCSNCKSAGVDVSQCQFHRVGSDNVHKVIDNIAIAQSLTRMANSNNMRPVYSPHHNNSLYSRAMTTNYPQLDSKSLHSSAWVNTYPEDTSPVDNYSFDSQGPYMPTSTSATGHSMYGPSFRWTHPTMRASTTGANGYFEQEPSYNQNGLPYVQTTSRVPSNSETHSPLDMSSLRTMLPERPHPRQYMAEALAPRRQILPVPQPNATQTTRNAVDQLQDQRLRSVHIIGTQAGSANVTDPKPLMPWTNENGASICVPDATSAEESSQLSASNYLGGATSGAEEMHKGNASGLTQINFSEPSLLDAVSTPLPPTVYSNFREARLQCPSPTNASRRDSHTNLYSFSTDNDAKRQTLVDDSSHDGTLVSGHRYVPLSLDMPPTQSETDDSTGKIYESDVRLHRSSKGKLNSF